MRWMKAFAAVVTVAAVGLAWGARDDMPPRVRVGDQVLRVREMGPSSGDVTVVFEVGLGGPLEAWGTVQRGVAGFARTVAYDRLASRHTGRLTARDVAAEVHAMLAAVGARPPYVMVGHSIGGIYCRVFADTYPEEVAGLVLVDPTQEGWVRRMRREKPAYSDISRAGASWPEAAGFEETLGQAEATAGRPPRVPVTVITGMARRESERDEGTAWWWGEHEAYVRTLPRGRHVAAGHSGHVVQIDEPGVVVEEIRRVVEGVRKGRVR